MIGSELTSVFFIKPSIYISHVERMDPSNFQGHGSNVKVRTGKHRNTFVNMIEIKPLCDILSQPELHLANDERVRILFIFRSKVKVIDKWRSVRSSYSLHSLWFTKQTATYLGTTDFVPYHSCYIPRHHWLRSLSFLLPSPAASFPSLSLNWNIYTFLIGFPFLLLVQKTNRNGKTNQSDPLLGHFSTNFNKSFLYNMKDEHHI